MSCRAATIASLVEKAQRGDREAVDQLVEQYRPRLLRMIRSRLDRRLRSRLDESDVVQEALSLAIRDLPNYRSQPHVPFYAWLRQIAWRQVLRTGERHVTTEKRSVCKERTFDWDDSRLALAEQFASLTTPSQVAVEAERIDRVMAALDALAEPLQQVLVLRFLERLSAEEAAAVQGISLAACRKRFTRALRILSRQLENMRVSSSRGATN